MVRLGWAWVATLPSQDDGAGGDLSALPLDGPPWLIALSTIVGLLGLTAPYWGPALRDRLRGNPRGSAASEDDTDTPEPASPSAGPPATPPPAERHDAQMALIESLVDDLQANYQRAEARAQDLSDRLAEAEQDRGELSRRLEAAERDKSALRAELDQAQATIRELRDLLRPPGPGPSTYR